MRDHKVMVPQGQHGGHQADQRAVVGMPGRVGLHGDVVGYRHLLGQPGLQLARAGQRQLAQAGAGAVGRDVVEAEAAAAEGKPINQIEKAPRESRPRFKKEFNKEETQAKGE